MTLRKILLYLLLTLAIFTGYYYILVWRTNNFSERGQFGDMFGTVNAFFTALAFFGILYTIAQQNEMIRKSKEQLDQGKREFDIQYRIQALTTLINLYQTKLDKTKPFDHLKANEIQKKINDFADELEKLLLN